MSNNDVAFRRALRDIAVDFERTLLYDLAPAVCKECGKGFWTFCDLISHYLDCPINSNCEPPEDESP